MLLRCLRSGDNTTFRYNYGAAFIPLVLQAVKMNECVDAFNGSLGVVTSSLSLQRCLVALVQMYS